MTSTSRLQWTQGAGICSNEGGRNGADLPADLDKNDEIGWRASAGPTAQIAQASDAAAPSSFTSQCDAGCLTKAVIQGDRID